MAFGNRLRELRKERDLQQSQLAEELGVSSSAVGSYERNEREPAYSLLIRISEYFGVSLDYMLDTTDEKLPVHEYLKQDSIEYGDYLRTHNVTLHGYEFTEEEKKRLLDLAIGMFWQKLQNNE